MRVPDNTSNKQLEHIARLASEQGVVVVTAESLTSGAIASRLGAGPDAAEWFAGGVIAYQEPVKFRVLQVAEGPVVSAECAGQMAEGARRLLDADLAVSATGVGGPEPGEGKPPGTVFVSVATDRGVSTQQLILSGGPENVIASTVDAALGAVEDVLREG
jgi:nicotinamide-nucleotide amidase